MNMENHRRQNHSNRVSHRLFPFSCRYNAFGDVVESSIVAKNSKNPTLSNSFNTQKHNKPTPKSNIQRQKYPSPTVKQSSSSNSGLFSTEEDEEEADSEIEIDDYFSLSSDSSISSYPEIKKSHPGSGFSSRRISELRISELGPSSSSSEPSTSSSINSVSPLKNPKPRLRVTLADKLSQKSDSLPPKTAKTEQLCSSKSKRFPNSEIQRCPIYMGGKMEESYALEKESNDPYKDFRESMAEMIVEKKINKEEDLEKLLLCFLSLNSPVFHMVILDVFSEICEAFLCR